MTQHDVGLAAPMPTRTGSLAPNEIRSQRNNIGTFYARVENAGVYSPHVTWHGVLSPHASVLARGL